MLCGILIWIFMPNVQILPHDPVLIAGTACLLTGEESCEEENKGREEDPKFRLETIYKRFDIYTVRTQIQRLVP